VSWADRLREEGFQSGFQEGFQEGLEEARQETRTRHARVVANLLFLRFGPLPDWAVTRVKAADLPTLEAWGDAVLDATSVEDLLQRTPPVV
jgi:hypothetical protein